ncbi:hypothetical protein Celal_3074 [Cellulophaga algicola DSM 14237]|uniref:Lipoprotein n=1 Tax=Cellulophaga algicola (strain DSM 14237 / IC166 / ACAM 630) TaxID=688270 RepID=E6XFB3_CELAD|nr:hypothetical protein [Cellulophaga algicola]ADV50349.1 hypothetical protein Celal_3074 [Cellulophaga algicola DSM 14237]
MKNWLFILLYCLLSSCVSKEKSKIIPLKNIKQKKIITTEKFDIGTFEKNSNDNIYSFKLDDGSLITLELDEDFYYKTVIPILPKLYTEEKRYYKSGLLESILVKFPNNFIISLVEYDKEGKLINKINYDSPFNFNFEQLVKLIESENDDIDILDKKNTTIGRKSDESGTFWFITYYKVPMRREVIKVHGVTGEILERSFYPHSED